MTAVTPRLADRAAGALANRFGRRGFFARSAVVGSALAANPVAYAIKPVSAYAAVCSCNGSNCECGSLCCDGYTEFCCTMTGANSCPPNTLLGGWWKVDGSGFCGGPRYYMDCNAPCNGCGCGGNGICSGSCSGTGCGCANGSCGNRKAGCTNFRYGQCNQDIACIGPIVCRVVTCVPPWSLDPTCTTTVRVDNATAYHDRPCLHRVVGALDAVDGEGHNLVVRGWALDFDENDPVPIHVYVDDELVASVLADQLRPDIGQAYPGWGDRHGFSIPVEVEPGRSHRICAYALNVGAGSTNELLGCRDVLPRSPFGAFDEVVGGTEAITARGWAIDPDTPNPIDVHLYVDGQGPTVARADRPRPDVGASHPGYGDDHGFTIELADVAVGHHEVCVYALNVGAGEHHLLDCRPVVVTGVAGFTDVPLAHPFATEIGWLAGEGIAQGYPDGTFRPTEQVSRQATAAFLQRLFVLLGGTVEPSPASFSDVPTGHPFASEIGWLAGEGIAEGYPGGTFRPSGVVSRQAMAAFLQRLFVLLGGEVVPSAPSFSDVPSDHPFAAQIGWLASLEITTGYPDGSFDPGGDVSRQAMAAFLYRLTQQLT
jgi:hypothetical protein